MIRAEQMQYEHMLALHDPAWIDHWGGPRAVELLTRDESEAWALFDGDDRVIACLGAKRVWGRVAEAWFKPGDGWQKQLRPIFKLLRQNIDPMMTRMALTRLQACVYETERAACRWAMAIGMSFECRLRAYGREGEDMVMYTRMAN